MSPLVSVVMPAYNAEKFITDAVLSVLNQTYQDYELIVIDDCSTDSTYQILTEICKKDNRIKLYRNAVNSGVSYTRNFGVSKACGEWIAFLDSDDIWAADKLEKQLRATLRESHAVISYTASGFMDSAGNRYSYVMHAQAKTTYKMMLRRNLMSCSSVMVKKDVFTKVKMASDEMHEDYSAWLKILREYPYAIGVDEPLLIYRMVSTSKSSKRIKSAKMLYNSYRYVGYNPLTAFVYCTQYMFYSVKKRRHIGNS